MLDWFDLLISSEPLPNFLFPGPDFTLPVLKSSSGKRGFTGKDFGREPSKTLVTVVLRQGVVGAPKNRGFPQNSLFKFKSCDMLGVPRRHSSP